MSDIDIYEDIEIREARHKLRGLVRCSSNHFTCAVDDHGKWIYFDDLSANLQEFTCVASLQRVYHQGCFFFAILQQRQISFENLCFNCFDNTYASSVDKRTKDAEAKSSADSKNPLRDNKQQIYNQTNDGESIYAE